MKKEKKIKPLPIVREYARYWLRRARRILKLKRSEYDAFHIDYMHSENSVEIWFFSETAIIAWATFTHDGHKKSADDKRKRR